jgi:hypothetical protein
LSTPWQPGVRSWLGRQPRPPRELEEQRRREAADRVWEAASYRAYPAQLWRVTGPLAMGDASDSRVVVDLPPGSMVRYEYGGRQRFVEWWGADETISHRLILPDGRRVQYLESWCQVDPDPEFTCSDPFPPKGLERA